jgi:general secretion pathway protein G
MMKRTGAFLLTLSVIVTFLLVSVGGSSAATRIDYSFGQGGLVIGDSGMGDDEPLALAIQDDGRIVVAGYAGNGAVKVLTVARYLADGTVDGDFAVNGVFTLSVGTGDTVAHGLVLQKDGGVVVSGSAYDGRSIMVVLRLTSDGYPDKAFADDGQLLIPCDEGEIKTSAVAAAVDGSVVVAGTVISGGIVSQSWFSRLDSFGQVDDSFGVEGKVVLAQPDAMEIRGLSFAAADELILAGGAITQDGATRAALLALKRDGTVAGTFGEGGRSFVPVFGVESRINDLLITADDKIMVAGYVNDGSSPNAFLAELAIDGSAAADFGTGGVLLGGLADENSANGLTVLADGSILATGYALMESGRELIVLTVPPEDVESAPAASMDSEDLLSDSHQSLTATPVLQGISGDDVGNAAAVAPTGQVIVAGFAVNGNDRNLILLRLADDDPSKSETTADEDLGEITSGYHIVTEPVTDITRVSAVSGGTITEIETLSCTDSCTAECEEVEDETCLETCLAACVPKPTVTLRGVCYSVKRNPQHEEEEEDVPTDDSDTTTDIHIFPQDGSVFDDIRRSGCSEDGSGTGSYASTIDEITPGLTYYVRAYAVLSDDTVIYGNEVSFKSNDACFIATAAYGSLLAEKVIILREFRDRYLMASRLGQRLVGTYYRYSPAIAATVEEHPGLKAVVRIVLLPVIALALLLLKTTATVKLLLAGGAGLLLVALIYFKKLQVAMRMTSVKRTLAAPAGNHKESGFTLIELLVVLVIIGILAGYIGPKIMGHPEEAKRTKAVLQIQSLETALKMYKLDNGMYPTTEQGLQSLVEPPAAGKLAPKWREGGYLDKNKIPLDPWGNSFVFLSPGVNGDFDLSSYGADGEAGGERDAKDVNNWEIE